MGLILSSSPLLHRLDYANLDNDEQEVIDALIEVASELIEKYCERTFARATFTEVINGSGDEYIILRNIPIESITSIAFRNQCTGEEETVDGDEFTVNEKLGTVYWNEYSESTSEFNGSWPEAQKNITAIYIGGYSDIPMPVQMVCAQMVESMYDPKLSAGIEKEKLGEYFYQINVDKVSRLLTDQNKMLALYRRRL
jgi:hypothetical protein